MFIENLRHVRKKNKILMIVLVALIAIGLLSTFAYLGSSFGGSSSGSGGYLDNAVASLESSAKTYEKSIRDNAEDTAALAGAVDTYAQLAAYQDLLLDSKASEESYARAAGYAEQFVALLEGGSTVEAADAATVFLSLEKAQLAEGNVNAARETFAGSWTYVGQESTYIEGYANAMIAAEYFAEATEDVNAFRATIAETETEFLAAIDTVLSNLQWQQMLAEYYASAATATDDGATDEEAGDGEATDGEETDADADADADAAADGEEETPAE